MQNTVFNIRPEIGKIGTGRTQEDTRAATFAEAPGEIEGAGGIAVDHDRVCQIAEEVVDDLFPAFERRGLLGEEAGLGDAGLGQRFEQRAPALGVLLGELDQDSLALLETGVMFFSAAVAAMMASPALSPCESVYSSMYINAR